MTALVMLMGNHYSRHDIINHAIGYRSCRRSNVSCTDDNQSHKKVIAIMVMVIIAAFLAILVMMLVTVLLQIATLYLLVEMKAVDMAFSAMLILIMAVRCQTYLY